ncbi:phosphatidate cytidylyltransferase [Planctomycetota bacterium]|nr:phosphatidate cytidylyltransferase [Planctomycetota bacterium]
MLKYRLTFGPIMIAVLLGLIWLDNQLDQIVIEGTIWQDLFLGRDYLPAGLVMWVLFLVLITLSVGELVKMFRAKDARVDFFMLWLSGMIGCTLMYVIPYKMQSEATMAIYASFMAGLFMLTLLRLAFKKTTKGALLIGSITMFGFIYIGVLPGFYLAIRRWHEAWVIAAIILIIKSCDIGAFFTGCSIGKHKMIPWLSPKKTWEGLAGGVIFAGLVAMGLVALGNVTEVNGRWEILETGREFVHHDYPLWFGFVVGMIFGLLGQAGDLTASMFKRDAEIKDSGSVIPGFGGLIDVLDSPVLVAPFAYWVLVIAEVFTKPI